MPQAHRLHALQNCWSATGSGVLPSSLAMRRLGQPLCNSMHIHLPCTACALPHLLLWHQLGGTWCSRVNYKSLVTRRLFIHLGCMQGSISGQREHGDVCCSHRSRPVTPVLRSHAPRSGSTGSHAARVVSGKPAVATLEGAPAPKQSAGRRQCLSACTGACLSHHHCWIICVSFLNSLSF